MQTPRLCIDARAASDFGTDGIIAQELVDQLVCAQGEEIASGWVEKKRTVLLSHRDQVFSGQLKRFDTRKKIGRSFLYWAWEKNFVDNARITAFHRFRPSDQLEPGHDCELLTTLLPPRRSPTRLARISTANRLVVPSLGDKILLERMGCPENQIRIAAPGPRQFVHHTHGFEHNRAGQFLIVLDSTPPIESEGLQRILESQFPRIPIKIWDENRVESNDWLAELRNTSAVFYLRSKPFDWPVLPLEALYFGIPVVFSKKNNALGSLVTQTPLQLESFLTELPALADLEIPTELARRELDDLGVLGPLTFAARYAEIYEEFSAEYPALN